MGHPFFCTKQEGREPAGKKHLLNHWILFILIRKKVKLKSQSQGSSCNCPFNETASGEEIQINSIIENVLLNINQTVQKLHTSIGSTSWAITTNWAFFCSTNLVTVLVPALRVLGFFEGVSSFLATFASALAFSLKN